MPHSFVVRGASMRGDEFWWRAPVLGPRAISDSGGALRHAWTRALRSQEL